MEKHYFIRLNDKRQFDVMYGTEQEREYVIGFRYLWVAKLEVWFKNRGLTKLREFNDRQDELFSGASLELPEE